MMKGTNFGSKHHSIEKKSIANDFCTNSEYVRQMKDKDAGRYWKNICKQMYSKSYSELKRRVSEARKTKRETIAKKKRHKLEGEYIRLVLQRLPFLFTQSIEVENYNWMKLAYDLKCQNKLLPELARYQIGPTFFVSFGPIATQLKREFFLLFLANDTRNAIELQKETHLSSTETKTSPLSPSYTVRNKPANDSFDYFTIEEVRKILIDTSERPLDLFSADFNETDACTKDWFHRWGWVYFTEDTCVRALNMQIGNYILELAVLDSLEKLRLGSLKITKTEDNNFATLGELIKRKKDQITNFHLPKFQKMRDAAIEELSNSRNDLQKYYNILTY